MLHKTSPMNKVFLKTKDVIDHMIRVGKKAKVSCCQVAKILLVDYTHMLRVI
jgi:hypothetical protein